jgi:hypothetical protein
VAVRIYIHHNDNSCNLQKFWLQGQFLKIFCGSDLKWAAVGKNQRSSEESEISEPQNIFKN